MKKLIYAILFIPIISFSQDIVTKNNNGLIIKEYYNINGHIYKIEEYNHNNELISKVSFNPLTKYLSGNVFDGKNEIYYDSIKGLPNCNNFILDVTDNFNNYNYKWDRIVIDGLNLKDGLLSGKGNIYGIKQKYRRTKNNARRLQMSLYYGLSPVQYDYYAVGNPDKELIGTFNIKNGVYHGDGYLKSKNTISNFTFNNGAITSLSITSKDGDIIGDFSVYKKYYTLNGKTYNSPSINDNNHSFLTLLKKYKEFYKEDIKKDTELKNSNLINKWRFFPYLNADPLNGQIQFENLDMLVNNKKKMNPWGTNIFKPYFRLIFYTDSATYITLMPATNERSVWGFSSLNKSIFKSKFSLKFKYQTGSFVSINDLENCLPQFYINVKFKNIFKDDQTKYIYQNNFTKRLINNSLHGKRDRNYYEGIRGDFSSLSSDLLDWNNIFRKKYYYTIPKKRVGRGYGRHAGVECTCPDCISIASADPDNAINEVKKGILPYPESAPIWERVGVLRKFCKKILKFNSLDGVNLQVYYNGKWHKILKKSTANDFYLQDNTESIVSIKRKDFLVSVNSLWFILPKDKRTTLSAIHEYPVLLAEFTGNRNVYNQNILQHLFKIDNFEYLEVLNLEKDQRSRSKNRGRIEKAEKLLKRTFNHNFFINKFVFKDNNLIKFENNSNRRETIKNEEKLKYIENY